MNDLIVPYGQLTFDAEGNDDPGSQYYSRKAHVPPGGSGVTVGRGYDLGNFSQAKVGEGLVRAGIEPTPWEGAFGLKGNAAKQWLAQYGHSLPEVTLKQQKNLFLFAYDVLKADVVRISTKADVLQIYGATDFDALHPKILDLVVDLRYRGDYSGNTRKRVQPLMVKNDLGGMTTLMGDRSFWSSVPEDRFKRRKEYLAQEPTEKITLRSGTPTTHVVQSGETLEKLSAKFGVSIAALKSANEAKLKTWGTTQGFNADEIIAIP